MGIDDLFRFAIPEEGRALVPTYGSPASAIDLYRLISIEKSDLQSTNTALTDINSICALTKIAEGGVNNYLDLLSAETALQALLLHESVNVLVPAIKYRNENDLISYGRFDKNVRTDLSFKMLGELNSFDYLIAGEMCEVNDRHIFSSNNIFSELPGRNLDSLEYFQFEKAAVQARDPLILSEEFGVPGYFSGEGVRRANANGSFAQRFYSKLSVSWEAHVGDIPEIVCSFTLPPLLAVVLDRMTNREQLLETIRDLRAELSESRYELHQLNTLPNSIFTEGELSQRVKRFDEAIVAIIPESRLTSSERIRRRVLSVRNLVHPIISLISLNATYNLASISDMSDEAMEVVAATVRRERIVDRTVVSSQFADLMNVEAIQSLVAYHFSKSEIEAIERSMPR